MATPTAAAGSAEHLGINVEELITRFSALDYAVFGMLLALSLAIGVYFGLCKRHEMTDAAGYLLGGRNMGVLPAAMSLIASFMSAITLLGTPAEVYQYGTQYIVIGFSYLLVMPAAAYLYMPVFFDLQLISVYEYLERRFHRMVRTLGAILFCIQMSIYMAIVVYAPSLALAQVTGVSVYLSVCLIFFVCIFYTALGGMKAVLWTDTIQMIIMFGAMLAIIIKGSLDVGGFGSVWHAADEGGRLEFLNFDPSPGVRHTVWTLVVGGYFTWITIYGVNQAQVQRYLCVPTKRKAAHAIWINLLGLLFLLIVCSYAGLVIYAKYRTCDPLTSGSVSTSDQLFPLFVMDTMGEIPGVPGLFVAGIFSGALSTVSSGINSLAAITLEDFIIPNRKEPLSHERQALITQVLAVVFGILGFVLVFVAEQLGDILQAALSLYGMVGGPLLGLFTLGMFFPWANYKGAMSGVFSGLFVIFWIGVGFQVEKAFGRIHIPKLPTSIDGCPRYNSTEEDVLGLGTTPVPGLTTTEEPELEHAAGPYYMSYMWYSTVASTVVVVVGMLVSLATGAQDPRRLDPRLIIPLGDKFKFLPQRWRNFLNFDVGINYESPKAEDLDSAFAHLPTTPSTFPLVEVVKRPAVSVDLNGDTDNGWQE
ncbi:sodium-coupled monocarboxylate transporter 1-like isoform X2 [Amphibalanus amphitrite]|uniref:sodium-coupled monocarboxylate transporter 1-like isoform X2 n=1 Tax=Amphibalanus amphitrite TaxID=1232801 RepID=UPI001C923873|nr:sodium-coupled monocarboxylate transporter 1-like isoform X2 [Amphibalanus amphitrite]